MIDNIILEWNKKRQKDNKQQIKESIIDFEHKVLSTDVFKNEKLKPGIKKRLTEKFDEIIKKLNIDEDRIVSYYIWGSITGKYYNNHTDIDAQIVVKYETEKEWEEDLKKMILLIPAGYEYHESAGDHPLNYYIKKYTGKVYPPTLDGMYDFNKDKWIKKQETTINIGDRTCLEVASGWIRKVESDLAELKRDIIDLKFFKDNKKQIQTIKLNEEDLNGLLIAKKSEIIYDLENLNMTILSLKNLRTENQTQIAEELKNIGNTIDVSIKNIHMFSGIITWKLLDAQGLINLTGQIRTMYSNYKENKLKKETLIKNLEKMIIPKDFWKH